MWCEYERSLEETDRISNYDRENARTRLFGIKTKHSSKSDLHGMIKNLRTLKERMRKTNTTTINVMDAALLIEVWSETLRIQLKKSIWFEEISQDFFRLLKHPKRKGKD